MKAVIGRKGLALAHRSEAIELGEYRTWMNHYLQDNLDIILKEAIPNNWDCLFVLFGREGCGKTTLGTQICKYLSDNFDLTTTVFTPDQFTRACEEAPPESAILWDEAITAASSATHASKISVNIISQLTQIRKKKLKIFLCFPYLEMLNKYFIRRCTGGIYIYAKSFGDRGYAKFYDHTKLSMLYGFMKERYRLYPNGAIKVCHNNFVFKFSKCFCLPEVDYDKKKEASRLEFLEGPKKDEVEQLDISEQRCKHPPSSILHNITKHTWTCRRCGEIWNSNPFLKEKPCVSVREDEGNSSNGQRIESSDDTKKEEKEGVKA